MSLEKLTEISRFYGKNPGYVLAGGGNTSWKDGDTLYIKCSGVSLAETDKDSFVKIDRKMLEDIWKKSYPESSEEREAQVLSDMMAARKAGEENKRPSVETLLHNLLPFNYVVHLHPALVNGLTCSQQGKNAAEEIFGDEAIWIESVNPGYVLSQIVKTAVDAYYEKHGKNTAILFLQNHGVFTGADSIEGIKEKYDFIMQKIGEQIKQKTDFSGEIFVNSSEKTQDTQTKEIIQSLNELSGASAFWNCPCIKDFVKDKNSFIPLSSAFSPDHIVYAGSDPLFFESEENGIKDKLKNAWEEHIKKTGIKPKIIAVKNLGIFAAGQSERSVNLSIELFKDAVKVSVYSRSFGGPLFMTRDKIDFINNWEVESYRTKVSAN